MPQVTRRRRMLVAHAATLVAALICVSARPAVARSCGPVSCISAASYDAVFEATVDAIVAPPPRPDGLMSSHDPVEVHLRDLRPIRGVAEPVVVTTRFASGGAAFAIGTRYLIFAMRREFDGRLGVGSCGLTRPLDGAAGLVRYVESLARPSEGGRIFGRVVVPDVPRPNEYRLLPIDSAHVVLDGPRQAEVDADASGAFEFAALPPGAYQVSVRLPMSRRDLSLAPEVVTLDGAYACADLSLMPRTSTRVVGVTQDEEGRPLGGVFVTLRPVVPAGEPRSAGFGYTTGPDGAYAFANVPPGLYRAGVSLDTGPMPMSPFAPTTARTEDGGAEINLRPGSTVTLAPLRLRRLSPLTITGRVVTANGTPVPDLVVLEGTLDERGAFTRGAPARTDMDGRFTIRTYHGRRHRLLVGGGRDPEAVVDVADPTVPQLITLTTR